MTRREFKIGIVGVGRMGANMARHLKDKDYMLTAVYDIDLAKSDVLANELGCQAAQSPAQVAEQSNTIITVVTDDNAMRNIYSETSSSGLLQHADGRLFLNCATLSPVVHEEVHALTEKHGAQSLGVCMASSIMQAREGTLYLMCGGKRDAFERAKPLLESLSTSLRFIGSAAEAAQVKALVNMIMNINTAGLAEGLGLGQALGQNCENRFCFP